MDLRTTLANNLSQMRREQEKTLEGFAEEIGISRSTLQEIESGRANATLETVGIIAGNLDISPLRLLEERQRNWNALVLLETMDCFVQLPPRKREIVAEKFCELVRLLNGEAEWS